MADKKYKINVALSNGGNVCAGEFVAPQGEVGESGEQGVHGSSLCITSKAGSVSTLPSPSESLLGRCYAVGDDNEIYICVKHNGYPSWVNFGSISGIEGPTGPTGPEGDTGSTGSSGSTSTITVAGTDTLTYDEDASVVNEGSRTSARLRFGIPQGKPGDKGSDGVPGNSGTSPSVSDEDITDGSLSGKRVHFHDKNGDHNFDIWDGHLGEVGPVGSVGDIGPQGPPPTLRQGGASRVDPSVDPWFAVTYIEDGVYEVGVGLPEGDKGKGRSPRFRTERFTSTDTPPFTRVYIEFDDDDDSDDDATPASSTVAYSFDVYDGEQGETGPQGPTGYCGPQGYCGQRGVSGQQGYCGPRGLQGPTGYCGLQGPQGDTGPQGPTGYCGLQGPTGYCGLQGPTGERGNEGLQGPTGYCGLQGPTGYCGPQGYCGLQGPQGDTGPEGPRGATGPQGYCGPQGATGDAGATGATGATGGTVKSLSASGATVYYTIDYGTSSVAQTLTTISGGKTYSTLDTTYLDSISPTTVSCSVTVPRVASSHTFRLGLSNGSSVSATPTISPVVRTYTGTLTITSSKTPEEYGLAGSTVTASESYFTATPNTYDTFTATLRYTYTGGDYTVVSVYSVSCIYNGSNRATIASAMWLYDEY